MKNRRKAAKAMPLPPLRTRQTARLAHAADPRARHCRTDSRETKMSDNQQAGTPNTPAASVNNNGKRKRMLLSLTAAIVVAGIGYGAYWGLYARHFESTDDAYVAGNVVQVTPLVGGTVVSIAADDTQLVTAGQPLIQLDRADTQVALEQAEAQL